MFGFAHGPRSNGQSFMMFVSSVSVVETFVRHLFVLLSFLIVSQCNSITEYRTCPGRTLISNVTRGRISIIQGGSSYGKGIDCVWMIQAPSEKAFITLNVSQLDTCSLDVLYLYEGCDGKPKRRLGALSGAVESLGSRIFIASECLLVQFVSYRTETYRQGFVLDFTIGSCPSNCIGGTCNATSGACTCTEERRGPHCEYLVAETCLSPPNRWLNGQCRCAVGWTGFNCSLALAPGTDPSPPGIWHSLTTWESQQIFTPRAFASTAMTDSALYVFGGRDDRQSFSDFLRLPLPSAGNWSRIEQRLGWPSARHGQAMWEDGGDLYMLGGENIGTKSVLPELWRWREGEGWTQLPLPSSAPRLVFHTVTKVEDSSVIVVGGRTGALQVSGKTYRLYVRPSVTWQEMRPRYGRAPRVFGHSAVYHPARKAVVVYGGLQEDGTRTGALHMFSTTNFVWTRLEGVDGERRAFHTATRVGEMMVVAGGSVEGNSCQSLVQASVLYYHLACHQWKDEAEMRRAGRLSESHTGDLPPPRFGHSAVLLRGHILLLMGGFAGRTLDQLNAYVLPNVVARPTDSPISLADHCAGLQICTADLDCAACSEGHREQCVPANSSLATSRNSSVSCAFMTCTGLCRLLTSCIDCQSFDYKRRDPFVLPCAWCSLDAKCRSDDRTYTGSSHSPCLATHSATPHWWESTQTISQLSNCVDADPPAGAYLAYLLPPMNVTLPDKVTFQPSLEAIYLRFIRPWPLTTIVDPLLDAPGSVMGFQVLSTISPLVSREHESVDSYIYPLMLNRQGIKPLDISAVLSSDGTSARFRPMVKRTTDHHEPMETFLGLEEPFPNGLNSFYLLRIEFTREYKSPTILQTRLELKWTPRTPTIPVNSSYLRPGQDSSQCSSLTNCLSCAMNAACGWCNSARVCQEKSSGAHCVSPLEEVITSVGQCPNCTQHAQCADCTLDPTCEWYPPALACIRRGRFNASLTRLEQCPVSCSSRTNCSHCLGESSCIWCDTSSSCMSRVSLLWNLFSDCPSWRDTAPCDVSCLSSTCASCLGQQACGWCHNTSAAHVGTCARWPNSPILPAFSTTNECTVNNTELAYYHCPPINECQVGLATKCKANSTCVDLPDGYRCQCDPGFQGDGTVMCSRTCYPACVHGSCSGSPDFECVCDLGYTGSDCATDCGCNRHSNCSGGVGKCDECIHGTTGPACNSCVAGHFGNTSSEDGCSPCNCFGHGKPPRLCDPDTGVCDCQHNTQNHQCSECLPGHHGNATAGEPCYATCEHRRLITNLTAGETNFVGWQSKETDSIQHCHWLVDVRDNSSHPPLIVVQVTSVLNIPCTSGGIFFHNTYTNISQALPIVPAQEAQVGLVDVVCDRRVDISIDSNTGLLGFYFIRDQGSEPSEFSFNFTMLKCPHCGLNRTCRDGRCQCPFGSRGSFCQYFSCPSNCSDSKGVCENGACRCHSGWSGSDCSLRVDDLTGPTVSMVTDQSPARFGHTLVNCGGRILLFGGETNKGLPSSGLYDFSETWHHLSCTGLCPPPMSWHAAVCDEDGSRPAMLILGPSDGALWRYEVGIGVWTRIPLSGYLAGGAKGHTLTFTVDRKIVMIGGLIRSSDDEPWIWNEDVWIFNTSGAVSKIKTSGQMPAGVYGHTAATGADSSDLVFLIGGYHSTRTSLPEISLRPKIHGITPTVSSDIYALHYVSGTWFLMSSPRVVGATPPAHAYAAAVMVGHSQVLVHGGIGADGNPLSDKTLRVYDLNCNVWSVANIDWRGTDSQVQTFAMSYGSGMAVWGSSKFLVVGGALAGSVSSLTLSIEQLSGAGGLSLRCRACPCATAEAQVQECGSQSSCRHCRAASLAPQDLVGAKFGVRSRLCVWCGNCDASRPCRNETSCGPTCTFTIKGLGASCTGEESCGDAASCTTCRDRRPSCEWSRSEDVCTYVSRRKWSEPSCLPEGCSPNLACQDCLGTSSPCSYSTGKKRCTKQTVVPLDCAGGRCGGVFRTSCPQLDNCTAQTICARCLAVPGCGWIAKNPGSLDGRGTCLIGGFAGPKQCPSSLEECRKPSLDWAFAQCQPENECENGHHNCDSAVEVCVDLPQGFRCDCKPGYERQESTCKPKCDKCDRGTCVRPNECECDFGFTGDYCDVECECNGLSNCKGPERDQRNQCVNCTQNTMGNQCQHCKPNFVGDPTKKGSECRPCESYCYGHTSHCTIRLNPRGAVDENRGPTDVEAVCVSCSNFTEGEQCETCKYGYFRLHTRNKTDPCQPCRCNGHNSFCDKGTGSGCDCKNNTRNDDKCDKLDIVRGNPTLLETCYRTQCSTCTEVFVGKPINGRQCYRRLSQEHSLCLDYFHGMAQCGLQPQKPLPYGRTILLTVPPRYMNVDVRIIVEMEMGEVDIYLAFDHQRFVITNDPHTWVHNISVEPPITGPPSGGATLTRRRRSVTNLIKEETATDFITNIRVDPVDGVILVKKVSKRVLYFISHTQHNLKTRRFYFIFQAISQDGALGRVAFRQLQAHIDLFVFFSVFFACFFLLLGAFIVGWKCKQMMDYRRSMEREAKARQTMASRPFARVYVALDRRPIIGKADDDVAMGARLPPITDPGSGRGKGSESEFSPVPVAVEPTDDGIACVGTLVIQMPGPVLVLGSGLMTMRVMYPSGISGAGKQSGPGGGMRRRASVSAC